MPTKTPKDYKRKREPFEFVIDGTTYQLRAPKFREMREFSRTSEDDLGDMIDLLTACSDEATMAAISDLDVPDVNELFADWIALYAPEGDAGKSGGSST